MENQYDIEDNVGSATHIVNYQRLLSQILKYWYLVILSLGIALFSAYLVNRYAVRIYPVSMSILIKESEEASGNAEILYNNPLVQGYRNYYNELYIIKSYPLVQNVVDNLGFVASFYKTGNVKTTEVYKSIPVYISLLSNPLQVSKFEFTVLSEDKFQLRLYAGDDVSVEKQVFQFNDTINYYNNRFIIRKRAVNGLDNFIDEAYILQFNSSINITRSYINRLKVDWAEEGASVINMHINGALPAKEIDFMNKLAEIYRDKDLDKKRQTAARSLVFIEDQLSNISDSLLWYETQLENFKENNSVVDISGQAEKVLLKIENLGDKQVAINVYNRYLDYLNRHLYDSSNLNYVILPTSVGINDPVLVALVTKMMEIQLQIKSYSSSQQINNPFLSQMHTELENLKESISESIANIEATNKIEEEEIGKKIRNYENELSRLPKAERKFITIQRNYRFNENLFTFLTQKRAEAGITKASETSDISVVNPAMQSGGAITPNSRGNYIKSIVLGLGFPLFLFLVIEYLNNKVQSKEDIEKLSKIPFSGMVGHNSTDTNLVVYNRPKSAVSEAFRSLRSNLNYFTENKDKKVFLVTSSISGEGKTFTSINLGTVLAYSGKKTVIVGADMRKPKIFLDFGLSNSKGLSSVLANQEKAKDVIQPTFIKNLYLISAGPIPPNPSEMLMKNDMEVLLQQLTEEFDYVILDTPPVALVTDAFVLSKFADHTIFITRQGVTPLQAVKNFGEIYKDGRIGNISVVLNDVKNNRLGYGYGYGYAYGYGYSYGYYADEPSRKTPFEKKG